MSQIINKFLQDLSVTEQKIGDLAVTTEKINTGAVTNEKIGTGIDVTKLGAGNVGNGDLAALENIAGNIQLQLNGKISASEKGVADGVATLDAGGKIPAAQLPNSVMEYQGTWNASTNSPTIADGTGNAGDVYRVGTAGTQDLGSGPITFAVGDLVIYNGAEWEKSPLGIVMAVSDKETFTLSALNITNQYIDLGFVAETDSIDLRVKGAPSLLEGALHDYSVSYTGGAGGVTRINFLNDLATGGAAALIAGDVVQVSYRR